MLRPDGKSMFYIHSVDVITEYQSKGFPSKSLMFLSGNPFEPLLAVIIYLKKRTKSFIYSLTVSFEQFCIELLYPAKVNKTSGRLVNTESLPFMIFNKKIILQSTVNYNRINYIFRNILYNRRHSESS